MSQRQELLLEGKLYREPSQVTRKMMGVLQRQMKRMQLSQTHYTFLISGAVVWMQYRGKYYSMVGVTEGHRVITLFWHWVEGEDTDRHWQVVETL